MLTGRERQGEVGRPHQYGVPQVLLVVAWGLSAATRLRGAGRARAVMPAGGGVVPGRPSWSSTRGWFLRLGYSQLPRAKAEGEDGGWRVDPVVQTGQAKCLLRGGLSLSAVPAGGEYLTHAEVEPIAVYPVTQSKGEMVYRQLEAARQRTGGPREILSAQGSELPQGSKAFCQVHPETSWIDDIKPKVAAVLKRELGASPPWQELARWAGRTTQRVQQPALAAWAPPRQRRKARYMHAGELGAWGVRMGQSLAEDGSQGQAWDRPRGEEAVGGVRPYRHELAPGRQGVEVGTITEQVVKTHGLAAGGVQQLQHQRAAAGTRPRTQPPGGEFIQFVTEEEAKAKAGERWVGSRAVIEASFGQGKRLEGEQARSGLRGLVWALGALGAPTTAEVSTQAVTPVPTKTVLT